jgi:hypothetical protein
MDSDRIALMVDRAIIPAMSPDEICGEASSIQGIVWHFCARLTRMRRSAVDDTGRQILTDAGNQATELSKTLQRYLQHERIEEERARAAGG